MPEKCTRRPRMNVAPSLDDESADSIRLDYVGNAQLVVVFLSSGFWMLLRPIRERGLLCGAAETRNAAQNLRIIARVGAVSSAHPSRDSTKNQSRPKNASE